MKWVAAGRDADAALDAATALVVGALLVSFFASRIELVLLGAAALSAGIVALWFVRPAATRARDGAPDIGAGRLVVGVCAFIIPSLAEIVYTVRGREPGTFRIVGATTVLGLLVVARSFRILRMRDATRRKLARREAYYRLLASNAADATLVVTDGGFVTDAAGSTAQLLGRGSELAGTPLWHIVPADQQERVREVFARARLEPGVVFEAEFEAAHKDGSLAWLSARIVKVPRGSAVDGFVVNLQDITLRKHAEAALTHEAFHDSLTGLANRALFRDRLEHALHHSARHHHGVAVLFVDLDNFKTVNDSLGHAVGDDLLRAVGARIRASVRECDTVARFGGDEFAVLVEDSERPDLDARSVAARVLHQLADPVPIGDKSLVTRASIGLAVAEPGADVDAVLRHADIAMYRAKAAGKGHAVAYEPAMQVTADRHMQIETELARALERDELCLFYQPIVDLHTEGITGFEALLRWHSETLGTVGPDEFIPVAEENGLIVPIGAWVLDAACRAAVRWNAGRGRKRLTMSVNLSARELLDAGIVERVARTIEATGIEPRVLVLEVTETVFIDDAAMVASHLDQLRALGVRIAIDDFGTGYSSLAHLREFHVDIIKIDRSFISTIVDPDVVPTLVRGLIDFGHALGLETIAEGVELDLQHRHLRDRGCNQAQGYLFARPMPDAEVDALLRHRDGQAAGEAA